MDRIRVIIYAGGVYDMQVIGRNRIRVRIACFFVTEGVR